MNDVLARPEAGLKVSLEDGLCRVTLHRPRRLNALTEPLRQALEVVVTALGRDRSVQVVCVSGFGRAFCAGMDHDEADSPLDSPEVAVRHQALEGWRRVLDGLERLPQVTVASLRGPVIGGGLMIATACDLRIAADDVRMSAPEVVMGGIPAAGGMARLVREIGLPRTRDLLLTGRVLSAAEGREWGLVTRTVPCQELEVATDALLRQLLDVPADALGKARRGLDAVGRATSAVEAGWADSDLMAMALGTVRHQD